ncbi:SGNH/GDSL hydrolase family protein [Sphingomonas crusticola]|uniref:SGNH/GDSL hydrolase family protein n=1 Tax=Sphingomonas crusticola TaxID=1697973 RepID=UPI000E27BEE4
MRGFSRAAIALALTAGASGAAPPLPVHEGGRVIRHGDGSVEFGWPATYFESRFHGTGVSVTLDSASERMRLLIDGAEKALFIQPGPVSMTMAGLKLGDHLVRLEKLTESQTGGGRFFGFTPTADGTPLPAPVHARAIEFVGDSYTVGYGDLSVSRTCTSQEVHDRTDSQQAFGPLLARRLGADYRVIAYSGFGIVRNYAGGAPGSNLPTLFARLKPDDAGQLDAPDDNWRPQLIVVNLGTNDFSTPLHAGEKWPDAAALQADYRASYVDFARRLRAGSPQATLILMGSDAFFGAVEQVAATLNRDGGRPVLTLHFGDLELTGCNYHPSLKDQAGLAASLESLIAQHPAIWGSAQP